MECYIRRYNPRFAHAHTQIILSSMIRLDIQVFRAMCYSEQNKISEYLQQLHIHFCLELFLIRNVGNQFDEVFRKSKRGRMRTILRTFCLQLYGQTTRNHTSNRVTRCLFSRREREASR